MTEPKPWNRRVSVASNPKPNPVPYCVSYTRQWPDGTLTHHSLTVDAYNPWAAETAFYWRIETPKGVQQTLIGVNPLAAHDDTVH